VHGSTLMRRTGARFEGDDRVADEDDEVQFWPIRPTAARSLRKGDQIAVPIRPQASLRATISDLCEDESARTITLIAELPDGNVLKKEANPSEVFQRLAQPGQGPPGSESKMVKGVDLWKWLGVEMNDPDGSDEKYMLRTYRRLNDPEHGEVVEVRMQSMRDPKKIRILTLKLNANIGFKGHR
jgi:hypothetical protein